MSNLYKDFDRKYKYNVPDEVENTNPTPAKSKSGSSLYADFDKKYNYSGIDSIQPKKAEPPEPTFAEQAGQMFNNAVDYTKNTALPAAQNALNNLGNNINNAVNNWGKDFDNTVNNFGNNLYNGISQIGNITYNPQQNLITGGGVSVTQPAPELKVNNNILNQVGGLLTNPKPQQQKFSLPQTTPNIPQYQPKQTGVLNPAVNAVGDVISEIGDSTFRTGARLLDNIYENSKKTRINPLTGEKSTVNDINMWTIAKGIRDTLDPAKAAYSDQNPAYFENKYFGSKENRGMLKALERGEIKPYTDEDFNYLQTNAVKNIDLKKNELQKLLDSGQISAQKADELYKGYINEVREQTKAQRVGMLEHNFRLQNEAEANFARVEQNSELANKAFAAYILAQTAGTVAPLELGGQKIGQAVTQAATKAAKEKLYKKLFYEEGLKAGLDKAVIDNAYKQVGKDFFLKNYAEKGFEEFGLTGAKKTAADMGQNLLKGTVAAATDMGVINALSNAAANNTALVDTGVNPVEAFVEGAKEGAPYGAMSLLPYAGMGAAKALENIKIKGKMKPYQTGTAVDIYKENPYVKYGYENGKGFYTYEDRTNGRTNKNFTEGDTYNRGGKKWEQIPQDIENLAPKTAAKQAAKEFEKVTESNLQAPEIAAQISKAANNIVPEVKPAAQPEQNQIADSSKMVENNDIDVEALAKERAELLNQDFIKQHRKYIESERKKGWEQNADNLEKQLEEYIASGKNQYEGQHNIDFANAIKDKDYKNLIPILAQGKGSNETSKKLFTKYTGVKLPNTMEGKKNAILEWAGKDIEEYNKEVKEAFDKRQAEREQKYKNEELEAAIKDLQDERIRIGKTGEVITKQEHIKRLVDSGEYKLEKSKQGIKPIYHLWNDKGTGYKFTSRAERLYIDSLYKNSAPQEQPKAKTKVEELAPNISKKQMIQEKVDKAVKTLSDNKFVPESQKQAMLYNMKGEEKEHFANLTNELQEKIDNAPEIYQTQTMANEDIKPVLHYFGGNFDFYATEIDKETGEMYGLGGFNGDYEFGYNSMENLKGLGDRLNVDLYPDKNLTVKDLLKDEVEKDENIGYNDNKETNYGHNESTVLQQSRVAEEKQGINEKSDRVAGNEPETSTSISRIGRSDNNPQSASGRRLTPEHEGIINKSYKNQHELNKAIEEFVNNKEYEKYDTLPDEVKDFLKKYSGAGGLEKQGAEGKGLLSEYYTPKNIVQKMWELTSQYINTDGAKVLEPSVGIGRFLEYAPKNTKFDVVEMNPISAKITELLYPNANVEVGQFQKRFINPVNNTPVKKVTPEYDIVIGNPPYGEYSGKYKGLGEGKGIPSNELYFIKRGLDTLKDNGVMTFIVPSSFLNNSINKTKMEISANAEILDAYRLPEKTFDTTSIGTDIIVLRKTSEPHDRQVFNAGKWFEEHPEKILGEVGERKNRFGKMENFVKGDKNAVEKIDTSAKNIKETAKTIEPKTTTTKTTPTQKATITKTQKAKKETKPFVQNNDYERYVPAKKATESEAKLWNDTSVDGSLRGDYKAGKDINQYEGKLYNDFNYLQGNIYEKLDALEKEDISPEQKRIQKEKLLKVLPEPKTISQIDLSPTSGFIKNYPLTKEVKGANGTSDTVTTYLDRMYLDWVQDLTNKERNGISVWDIRDFVNGKVVRTPYKGNPTKEEKENQRAEFLTKLKNTVDKTFNDFINTTLTAEELDKLQDTWNRNMNSDYVPDYKDMPLMVKDLNSKFYGDKLTLQDVQIEGINYLTNKGVGLLGFEVGVGKTLSGIISTVQNMQMGRCKRPLILVPKSVKPNWIREIHEAFPNIKVNDVDNLSKFKGEIEDGTLTVGTYQALDNIWYNEKTIENLTSETAKVRTDFEKEEGLTKRGKEKTKDKNEEFISAALKGNKRLHTFEDLGFDHITVDEAHNFKNLFGDAKADDKDGNPYTKIKGAESTRAKRLFLASQYVLNNNNNRNIFMLTATPFNNSPLEVFNMLSYLAKDKLDKMGINNVYQFMENYVDLSADWVVDSKNEVSFKQIAKGFKNLGSLQNVIDSVMLMRSAEDAGIKRPNKVTKHFALNPTDKQKKIIAKTEALAVGIDVDDEGNIRFLDKEEKKSAQLKALTQGRIAALSPDIYEGNLEVSPEDFIKNSPKLDFIMQAVEKMQKQDPSTSQLIYMPIGVDFLPKMKEYLVNKGVYKPNEIEIIQGGISDDKISAVSDSFNDPNGDVKLIIGTNKIKEGMNLNKNSSVLYVPFIDWNPTDYVQVVGRIWRRGNKYKNIRIVVPTLNDSSDSFMYQKLDEKTSRINNIMSRGVDYIDTGELNAAEEKINMITDPEKKAKMFTQIEQQKLESRKNELEGTLQDSKYYQSELQSAKNNIDYYGKQVERLTEELSEIEDKESWQYSNKKTYLESYKKDLKNAERHLENLENKIKRLELDFAGKDSVENIQKRIEDVKKQIENIKETTQIKLEEYKKEYIKNRVEGKKIEDYIKEFDEDTTNGGFLETESLKQIGKKSDNVSGSRVEEVNALTDVVYDKLSKVLKISKPKLSKRLSAEIKVSDTDNIAKGEYSDKNVIEFFKGADASTSVHEVGHWLLNTWEKLAPESPEIARDLKSIRKHLGNNGGKFTKDEQEHFASSLEAYMRNGEAATPRLEKAFARFKRALKTIYKTLKEIIFKQKGEDTYFNRKDIKNINDVFNRIFTTEEERIRIPEEKAEKEASEHIRNWVGEIGKNRYDVNKTLNSLINITNQKAKSFKVGATGEQLRELMPFLRERTDFPDKLNRPDLQKIWNKLSDSQKAELRKLADDVSAKFERFYKEYQDLKGVLSDSEIKNHISHLWETKNKKQEGLLTNYFATNSRFAKERTIESLYKGIQGIETESGETLYYTPKTLDYAAILKTSSDSFIKAISDIKLAEAIKDLKVGGQKAVLPSSKAPSDWVEIDHPALNKAVYMGTSKNGATTLLKQSVKVHPAVAETLKTVFETPKDPNKFVEILRKYNITAKMAELGLSAFHTVALSEAAVGNLGIKETLKVLNPVRAYKEIKYNDYGIYKDEALAKRAIDDGLQFGSTLDLDRKTIENLVDNLVDIVNKGSKKDISSLSKPIAETLKTGNKALKLNNKILWDYLHNNYKLIAYDLLTKRFGKKIQKKQDRELSKAERREVAQWVNDSYGGQIWEFLKLKPSERNLEQFLLLSADWLRSTTRQFMGMFSSKMTHNLVNSLPYNKYGKFAKTLSERWGVVSNTGDIEASALRGQLAREFWTRVAVISAIGYNTINAICREWDRKHHPELYPEKMTAKDYTMLGNSKGNKFNLFIGRNSDGTERYARVMKQFKEVPEMLLEPNKKLGGKLSPVIQLASQLFTGHTASGFKNKDFFEDKYPYTTMKTGTARLAASAKTIGKSFAPYSLNDVFNPDKDFTPVSFFLPVSKGTTKGKGKYEFAKNIYDKKNVKEVAESLKRNGYSEKDIKKTYKSARSEVRRQYRDEFVKAIESGDKKKVKEVAYRLRDKKGLSEAEITLIYKKAIKKVKEKE